MRTIKCRNCGQIIQASGAETLCPDCRAELAAASVVRPRICRSCGAEFPGGPRAWYCPACRAERAREASRTSKRRSRAGAARKLGSTDVCQICGAEYVVTGSLQKYCPACAADAVKAVDREQGRVWAAENREANAARKKELAQRRKVCRVCGEVFSTGTTSVTCSPGCAKVLKSYRQAVADHKRRGSPLPTLEEVRARLSPKTD